MTLDATLARVAEIRSMLAPPIAPATPRTAAVAGTASTTATGAVATASALGGGPGLAGLSFADQLRASAGPQPLSLAGLGLGGGNPAIVAIAQREVGQAEQPPGSNDSPRIAAYRTATAGSGVAPWCGYFVSWVARQAGMPIGDGGSGLGSVDAIWSWAERNGRAQPVAAGPPRPGDLIVWDEHIGIVEGVLPDGRIQTIEGNSSDQVARRIHPPGDAIGYVRMS